MEGIGRYCYAETLVFFVRRRRRGGYFQMIFVAQQPRDLPASRTLHQKQFGLWFVDRQVEHFINWRGVYFRSKCATPPRY